MKKIMLILAGLITLFALPQGIKAATTMPETVEGVVTLTEDVTLSESYAIAF